MYKKFKEDDYIIFSKEKVYKVHSILYEDENRQTLKCYDKKWNMLKIFNREGILLKEENYVDT